MSCYNCGSEVITKKVNWISYVNGIKVVTPNITVESCPKCGEMVLDSKESEKIDRDVAEYYNRELALEVKLKEVRDRLGLTQEEVAKRMGWSKQRYNTVEKNKKVPSVLLALKLANALECDVNDIYKLKIVPKKPKINLIAACSD
ncbi:MAG: helix-turn-helix domain-containing protein [Peptococcaceae bacterium]|nr:helix-turn-helix domain-containing protein [Peptococcaceae bacterium]